MIQPLIEFVGKYAEALVGLCALGLTIYQAQIARRHNKLSVRPHLITFTHRHKSRGRGTLAVRLLNKGVGPAFIKSFRVLLDGEPVINADQALSTVLAGRQYNHSVTTLSDDYAVSAGEEKDLLLLVLSLNDGDTLEKVEEQLDRFDVVVEYESAYKEPAILDTRMEVPRTLKR